MDTIEISSKFKNYISRNNSLNLDSNYLKQLNREYQSQYDQMNEKDAILKFLNNMASYLKYSLTEDGHYDNPNSPQDYLMNLATIGTYGITVYSGYIPKKYEKKFKIVAEKYLKQFFHLKNFDGFNLIFNHDFKNTCITNIRLTWNNTIQKSSIEHSKSVESDASLRASRTIDKFVPLDIISPTIYDPTNPNFEEYVKFDIQKNISKLREHLEQTITPKRHRHRRRHRSSTDQTINQTSRKSIQSTESDKKINKSTKKIDSKNKKIDDENINKKIDSDSNNEGTSSEYANAEIKFVNDYNKKDSWTSITHKDIFELDDVD